MPVRPIRVLMLGWEYPPLITGGLGTACEGLTKALALQNIEVTFVMPSISGQEQASHMRLYSAGTTIAEDLLEELESVDTLELGALVTETAKIKKIKRRSKLSFHRISSLLSPYLRPEEYDQILAKTVRTVTRTRKNAEAADTVAISDSLPRSVAGKYGADIFKEVRRFSLEVASNFKSLDFDIIHAHDWMTYTAGMMLADLTGKPLVVHVHSAEFDRSGEAGNPQILEIEQAGMLAADRVIAVSAYTRSVIHQRYGIPFDKITVVHNGIEARRSEKAHIAPNAGDRQIVLFLGRITFQKGPDYFVEAAAKVLQHLPETLFVMAGTGDMLPRLQARVRQLGIEDNFSFPGFLNREKVEEMFALADLYVMPSVSEPFGISCLEAVSKDTPVIVSRQSGVSEVLSHALKVDFWDVEKLADFIANSLEHEELRSDLVDMSKGELSHLNWDYSGGKVKRVYQHLLGD